jgi:hypothetical protein
MHTRTPVRFGSAGGSGLALRELLCRVLQRRLR